MKSVKKIVGQIFEYMQFCTDYNFVKYIILYWLRNSALIVNIFEQTNFSIKTFFNLVFPENS